MGKTLEIFISSAGEDERFLNMLLRTLEASLKPLRQQRLVEFWHERDIRPGAIFEQEKQKHLRTARVFLLLVSIDFMNLNFCYSEDMKHLIQRHKMGEIHSNYRSTLASDQVVK
jgi:hypothetical protein